MLLHHGTTLKRAEAILANGPDPNYDRPPGATYEGGFSMAPPNGPFPQGEPRLIALALA